MKVDAETLLCASIGYPNRATLSPIMHNAGFEVLGINYVYLAFEPTKDMLAGAIESMRALRIRGFSVSKPYKEAVIQYLDELDETARAIGAVNTIVNDDRKLIGYNSDWIGAVRSIEEITEIRGKRIALVGCGGVGRAIVYGLKKKDGEIIMYNRLEEQDWAIKVASEFEIEFGGGIKELEKLRDYDILINATSVGFFPNVDNTIIPRDILFEGKVVLDVVFNPWESRLIKEARQAGCKVVRGSRMLLLQGAFQFKLFTGYNPPLDIMQKALEKSLKSK